MYRLPEKRYTLPLTCDEQQELLGELMSARAKVRRLWQRVQLLEEAREELTKMVQEIMPQKKVLFKK